MRKALRRPVERAGLDAGQVTSHIQRHTAVAHLVQSEVDLPTVQRLSGRNTLAMVARYAHQNGADLQGAMDRLQRRVAGTADQAVVDLNVKIAK
jgi:site-specific recombinase XerD